MKLTKEIEAKLKALLTEKESLFKQLSPIASKIVATREKKSKMIEERQELLQKKLEIKKGFGLKTMTLDDLEGFLDQGHTEIEQQIKAKEESIKAAAEIISRLQLEASPFYRKVQSIASEIRLLKKAAFNQKALEIVEEIKTIAFAFNEDFYDPLTPNWQVKNQFASTDEAREIFYENHPEFKVLEDISNSIKSELHHMNTGVY